jgi:hypothetical protein
VPLLASLPNVDNSEVIIRDSWNASPVKFENAGFGKQKKFRKIYVIQEQIGDMGNNNY